MKIMRKYKLCFGILSFLFCISFLLHARMKDHPLFGIANQVKLSLSERSAWENVSHNFFDSRHILSVNVETVYTQTGSNKELITKAIVTAASYLNRSVENFEYGQYRLVREGIEFDVYFNHDHALDFRKVNLFFPFSVPKIIFDHNANGTSYGSLSGWALRLVEIVHIIVPLKGNIKAIKMFADNIVNNIYPVDDRITLTVIYFQDEAETEVRSLLRAKFANIPKFNWTFISTSDSSFSRGKGIRIGANYKERPSSDLLFFCDIDIIMRPNFIRRCRTNSIQGRQVYYPIVYSLYNPDLVYGRPNAPPMIEVRRNNGFWQSFGYGMVCLHKEDFDSVGGIPELKSWRKGTYSEDIQLFHKLSTSVSIEYIRTPDPDLFRIYYHKDCSNLSYSAKKDCIKSKIYIEGTQLQLGLALYKLRENKNISSLVKT